ncbi:MAG TPA: DNA alkylation repair protein [Nitrososphaerales archaeon]|nr:DNA alkylation repair protein [Nitrososphaerales archaeon]
MSVESVLAEMRARSDPEAVEGMARFGISSEGTLGLSMPFLRSLAKRIGRDHRLAEGLWESEIHEARILATLVDEPKEVTAAQMERWVDDFDSWDVCDGCCGNLFDRTPYAHAKALEWAERDKEFVKRAGYVLMAELAVHDKATPDEEFVKFFGAIERGSTDSRNFVKKAVNWALRQIGKRNQRLNRAALELAEKISKKDSPSAKWVASDAIRELSSDAVQTRLRHSS